MKNLSASRYELLFIMTAALIGALLMAVASRIPLAHADATSTTATSTDMTSMGTTTGTTSSSSGMLTGTVGTSSMASSTATTSTPTGTLTGSVGTSTSTTTQDNTETLIAALRDLQLSHPQFWALIQSWIEQLMGGGMGTTTPPQMMGPAHIDQDGQMKMAGDQIDFGGHNFGHEEQVLVTLNGQFVATAHADSGGNFSTGSLRVPTMPGTYTYMFQGQTFGDSATATLTVH